MLVHRNNSHAAAESQPPADIAEEPIKRLSAKATRKEGTALTDAEIEAAEAEAGAWARKANSC